MPGICDRDFRGKPHSWSQSQAHCPELEMSTTGIWRNKCLISPDSILCILYVFCVTPPLPHTYTHAWKKKKNKLQNIFMERAGNWGIFFAKHQVAAGGSYRIWVFSLPKGSLTSEYKCSVRAGTLFRSILSPWHIKEAQQSHATWAFNVCSFLMIYIFSGDIEWYFICTQRLLCYMHIISILNKQMTLNLILSLTHCRQMADLIRQMDMVRL